MIVDASFLDDATVSVLLEEDSEKRTAILAHVPLAVLDESMTVVHAATLHSSKTPLLQNELVYDFTFFDQYALV